MDRAHGAMTVICDAPLIWLPSRGVCGRDLKCVYFRNDSQRYVYFVLTGCGGPVLCKHMVWRHREDLKLLKQLLSYSRNKNLFDIISERAWQLLSYLFLIFCRIYVNNGDNTVVMRHICVCICYFVVCVTVAGMAYLVYWHLWFH